VLEEKTYEESYQEYPNEFSNVEDLDETFDEDEVLIFALPFDKDIQASIPPAHQEENMMSCDPFEYLDNTLFHDFGSEEVLEETSLLMKERFSNLSLLMHMMFKK